MSINESLITPEVLNNTLKREVYPEIKVVAPPRMGKVRTIYDRGDSEMLMISSDNLSTHNVVHRRQVYAKGENLDKISSHYFETTNGIINHFIRSVAPNTWLVRKADRVLIEMVLRQYLTGSGWRAYVKENGPEQGMKFCGVLLRPEYRKNEKLDELIFTPAAKGKVKDFPIHEFRGLDKETDDPELTVDMIRNNYKVFGLRRPKDFDFLMGAIFKLFSFIHSDLESKGYLLADTKWEFGYFSDGTLGLIDECVTPDSSRIWNKDLYSFNPERNEFTVVQDDKQHFRDHIEKLNLHTPDKKKELARYWIPDEVLKQGVIKYCNIRETITGTLPKITTKPKKDIILKALADAGYLN